MKKNFQEALSATAQFKDLPFPEEEYFDRLQRLRKEMSALGIDLLFLSAPESIFYLIEC